jgi:hypothetical protein
LEISRRVVGKNLPESTDINREELWEKTSRRLCTKSPTAGWMRIVPTVHFPMFRRVSSFPFAYGLVFKALNLHNSGNPPVGIGKWSQIEHSKCSPA